MLPIPRSALLAALLLAPLAPGAARAEAGETPAENRPPGLVLLQQRLSQQGMTAVGVYGVEVDATTPGLRRVKVWEERPDNVTVRVDSIRCTPAAPMRVTSDGSRFFLRELNPGGAITAANRMDHLIWWATCFPELAGQEPAGLAARARQLGYSGLLRESEQVLPGRSR